MRKMQVAAATREEQLVAQSRERERSTVEPLQQQVSHEIATKEEAARQLEDMRRLHADAERRVAVLQGTLFAQGSATPMQRRDPCAARGN